MELAAEAGGPVAQGSAKGWEEGQEPAQERMAAAQEPESAYNRTLTRDSAQGPRAGRAASGGGGGTVVIPTRILGSRGSYGIFSSGGEDG